MFANFVSDVLKAAVVDLLFKRPVQVHLSRDASGKFDFRANINPSSGTQNSQPPVVVMQSPYGYPYAPPPFVPPYPGMVAPPGAPASLPHGSGAQSQTPAAQVFEIQAPSYLR